MIRFFAQAAALAATGICLAIALTALSPQQGLSAQVGLVAGAIYLLVNVVFVLWPLFFRRRHDDDFLESQWAEPAKGPNLGVRVLVSLAGAALIAAFRSVLLQLSVATGGAMLPNYPSGTPLVVAKYAYGYGRYSFPFGLIPFSGRLFGSEPARGDVILYRNRGGDAFARVVGLPGDQIQIVKGVLVINGTPVPQTSRAADGTTTSKYPKAAIRTETLPNGISYDTLDLVDNGFYDNTNVYKVPPGALFTIGDNRDNSTDSRTQATVGYVPNDNVIGRIIGTMGR